MVWVLDYTTGSSREKFLQLRDPKHRARFSLKVPVTFFLSTKSGRRLSCEIDFKVDSHVAWVEKEAPSDGVVMTDGCGLISLGVSFPRFLHSLSWK